MPKNWSLVAGLLCIVFVHFSSYSYFVYQLSNCNLESLSTLKTLILLVGVIFGFLVLLLFILKQKKPELVGIAFLYSGMLAILSIGMALLLLPPIATACSNSASIFIGSLGLTDFAILGVFSVKLLINK